MAVAVRHKPEEGIWPDDCAKKESLQGIDAALEPELRVQPEGLPKSRGPPILSRLLVTGAGVAMIGAAIYFTPSDLTQLLRGSITPDRAAKGLIFLGELGVGLTVTGAAAVFHSLQSFRALRRS